MGIAALCCAFWQPHGYRTIIVILLIAGLLSDIFDGIIARRLGVSNERMRRLDSGIDQVFWILILLATYLISPAFFTDHLWMIGSVVVLEIAAYAASYIKFRKEVSTHAILSKIWTLTMFAAITQAILTGNSGWVLELCCWLGIITRFEIIFIVLILRQWTSDVPCIYHAIQLRQGKKIKRSKWFNG